MMTQTPKQIAEQLVADWSDRSKQKKIDQRAEYWRQSNLTEISAGTIKMHWRTWKIAMAVFFFTILLGIAVIESRALFGDDIRDALKHLGLALMIVGATGFLVVSSAHCKDDPEDGESDRTS